MSVLDQACHRAAAMAARPLLSAEVDALRCPVEHADDIGSVLFPVQAAFILIRHASLFQLLLTHVQG